MPNPDDLEKLYKAHMETLRDDQSIEQDLRNSKITELEKQLSEPKKKPILCLDFDGVCHSYTSGWKGADVIPDPPVPGLFEFLQKARDFFDIQIYSTRSETPQGRDAMWIWFCKHWTEYLFRTQPELKEKFSFFEISFLSFPNKKPPALVTLDDRALTFTGEFPDMETLKNFKPWNKK